MEDKSAHERRRSSLLLLRRAKASSPSMGFNAATLDFVVAVVQYAAHLGQFGEIASHSVFDKLLGSSACRLGKFLQPRLGLGFQM